MSFWKLKISDWFETSDRFIDKIKTRWRGFKGYDEKLKIHPYLGFGTTEVFYLRGRVVEEKSEIVALESDNRRRNLSNFFRRFATDEVPFARIRASFYGVEKEIVADDEGYFYLELPTAEIINNSEIVYEIELELISPRPKSGAAVRTVGKILTAPPTAKFGIISDLDDTVISTEVTSKVKMLINTALRNEYTRSPFKGVAAFYKALQKGIGGGENNPIFYVSSSPWNLYPLLSEFLRINRIPLGALFLKDFGNRTIFDSGNHAGHKIENIERILNVYPHLPFVLIGDSGEKDPEIYAEIVKKYPNRISVIYIRNVNLDPSRVSSIDSLIAEIKTNNCQLVLSPDTEFAAVHAADEKLIDENELANIREEKKEDELSRTPQEITDEKVVLTN
jgi:phosphatidate phosphatase APP1